MSGPLQTLLQYQQQKQPALQTFSSGVDTFIEPVKKEITHEIIYYFQF